MNPNPNMNGRERPQVHQREISMNDQMIHAINAALVAATTGVQPELSAEGKWTWTFPADSETGQAERVYTGEPPPWVPNDKRALDEIMHALMTRDGVLSLEEKRAIPSEDGLLDIRAMVQIGFPDKVTGKISVRSRAEASPPELALALALCGYLRIDVDAWEQRLFPKLAAANDAGPRRD